MASQSKAPGLAATFRLPGRRFPPSRRYRLAAWLLVGLLALVPSAAAMAQGKEQGAEFHPRAPHIFLMDADSGAILYQHGADEQFPPASLSKLMTLALLFKALKAGQLQPSDEFVMSVNAWRHGGAPSGTSAMMVPVNTKVRLDELIQGIVVQSGNDAAMAVAEGMAGSEAAFARLMDEEGKRIGLKKSSFRNATGLYHPEHLMTVRDLAVLARYIIREYPEQYAVFSQREFLYRRHKFLNRNPLLFLSLGVDGMKTGFIKEGGYGIVASAKQNDRRLIAVVGGAATADERKEEARKLLEWGFRSFTEFKLFDAGEIVGEARVWGGDRFYLPLTGNGELSITLPRYPANQKLRAELVYNGPLKAPIHKGEPVARLRVTSSSNAVNEVQLFAAEDVGTSGMMRRGLDSLAHLATRWMR